MKRVLITILVVVISIYWGRTFIASSTIPTIQNSHIDSHAPPAADFSKFLERDLLIYSRAALVKSATKVEFMLLRDSPTQSGVSLPKYYLWLKILENSKIVKDGAVLVAAVNRRKFEVTDFISAEEVRENPNKFERIFPALLIDNIKILANTKQVPSIVYR